MKWADVSRTTTKQVVTAKNFDIDNIKKQDRN